MRMIGLGLFLAGAFSLLLAPVVVGVRIVLLFAMSILLLLLGDKGRKVYLSFIEMRIEQEKRQLEFLEKRRSQMLLKDMEEEIERDRCSVGGVT